MCVIRLFIADFNYNLIICCYCRLEKDPHESSQKPSHSQDISQKVLELHKKLELAKEQVGTKFLYV